MSEVEGPFASRRSVLKGVDRARAALAISGTGLVSTAPAKRFSTSRFKQRLTRFFR